MARHLAMTTQQAHPWRAALRTFVEVLLALPAGLSLLVVIIDTITGDEFARYLPDSWVAWLASASVVVAALAGLLARLLAIPAVDAFLRRLPVLPLASDPGLPTRAVPVGDRDQSPRA